MASRKPKATTKKKTSKAATKTKAKAAPDHKPARSRITQRRSVVESSSRSIKKSPSETTKKVASKPNPKVAKSSGSSPGVGRVAPAFTLLSGTGEEVALKELRGKLVVLYFYPKDMTPGCTTEACDFRDRLPELKEAGAVVLGVSADSPESHAKFAAKHGLQFPLLADSDVTVATKYGVWQEKSLYGRKFMGNVRTTFIIDRDGRIARVWRNVKVANHADEVLANVRELAALPV